MAKNNHIKIFIMLLFSSGLASPAFATEQRDSAAPIENFGQTLDRLYRGAKPRSDEEYRFLAQKGVNTVIDLQTYSSDKSDQTRKYGIEHIRAGMPVYITGLNMSQFETAFGVVAGQLDAGKTVYIHCYIGRDRTSAMAVAALIRYTACGKQYDKDRMLWKVLEELDKYEFGNRYYGIYSAMREWVYNLEEYPWICRQYPPRPDLLESDAPASAFMP